MIRNLNQTNVLLNAQTKTMAMLSKILKSQQTDSAYFIIFIQILSFFPLVSSMFKNDPLAPKQSNQVFKFFMFEEFANIVGFSNFVMSSIIFYSSPVFIICIAICYLENVPKQFVIFFSYFLKVFQFLAVPMFYYSLVILSQIINGQVDSSTQILNVITFVLEILNLCFILLYTYFQIRPMRSSNFLWNYENSKEFNHLVLDISRSLVIVFDGISPVFLCTSLMAEIYLVKCPQNYLNPQAVIFNKCRNTMICIVNAALLINCFIADGRLTLVLLAVSLILVLLLAILNFIAIRSQANEIPSCKPENCKNMYNFYIGNWHRNKTIQSRQEMSKINTHYMCCNSKNCAFAVGQDGIKITNEDIQQKITKFLKSFRYSSPESELMYQIWKIELNKTITLQHKLRNFTLPHKFVVIYAIGPESSDNKKDVGNNNSIINNLALSSMNYKWKFYKQLSSTVNMFEKMGEAMTKSLPQLKEIISAVIGIYEETYELNILFEDMVKSKQINYVCVELYMKFVECFLDPTKMPVEILDRLKRLKVLKDSQAIEENSLPCFVVEGVKNTIQKVNWQTVKFLKMQKYEMKDKNFMDFIVPSMTLKQLENLQNQNNQKQQFLPIFFKLKSQNTTLSKNIKIKLLSQSNKNYYEVVVHKRNNSRTIIQLLIDQNESIIAASQNHISLMYKHGKQEKQIDAVYEQEMKKFLSQVSISQIVKIEFGKGCLYAGLLVEKFCPYPGMRFLVLNLVKKINPVRNTKKITNIRLTKIYSNQSQFRFQYNEDISESLVLLGSQNLHAHENNCLLLSNTTEIKNFNEQLNKVIENIANPQSCDFGIGIKVYRLFDGELYNIDLEDKAKYEEQFEGMEVRSMEQANTFEIGSGCLCFLLLTSTLAIISISIYLYLTISNSLETIQNQQRKHFEMEQFSLNFNRILAILRDTSNGLFETLNRSSTISIMDSYQQLMKIDSSLFFSDETYRVSYDSNLYEGTLSQLIEICLTHVFQFLQSQNILVIEKIHQFSILQLGSLMSHEKLLRLAKIEYEQEFINNQRLICFLLILVSSVLYYIFWILVSQRRKKQINAFLEPVLIVSQPEVRRILQECEKFNNVICSLFKNYEVDLEILDSRKGENSKRIKAKKTNIGVSSVLCEIVIGFILIGALIILSYFQFNSIHEEIQQNKVSFMEGSSVVGIYTQTSWLTNEIEHTGEVDETKIDDISDKLAIVENDRYQYQFSDFLCEKIKTVFFNSSCDMLVKDKIIGQQWCGNSFVGFEIKDPFGLSVDIFFRRIEYNFVSNITDTFAATGVYSDPFKEIFLYFSQKIKGQIDAKMIEKLGIVLSFSVAGIFISFILFLVMIISSFIHYHTITVINKGLASLTEENKSLDVFTKKEKKVGKNQVDQTQMKLGEDGQASLEDKSGFQGF